MNEQNQTEVIGLDMAASEFSNAFSPVIAKLVFDKLSLIYENAQLKARIAKLEDEIASAKPSHQDKSL